MLNYLNHSGKFILILALVAASCKPAKKEPTLADTGTSSADDKPKDEIAFRLKDVNLKTVSFLDNTGKQSKALSLPEADFSDEAIMIVSIDEAHKGQVLNNIYKKSTGGDNPQNTATTAMPKCWSTWYYNNVPVTLYCQIYDPHMTDRVLPRYGTKLKFPPLTKKVQPGGTEIPVYQCNVTVYGNVKCENICSCAACITCFFSSNAVSMIVDQPERAEDFVEYAPCNSINNCSDDGRPDPPNGGGGGDSLAKKIK